MTKAKGLKPKDRKLVKTPKPGKQLTANQWTNTPQQNLFMQKWLDPKSPTFSNAYQSAIEAGYSTYYAQQITSRKSAQNWITEYVRSNVMTDEHVRQGIQELAIKASNSRSPDDTRLKAYELLGKATGLLTDKKDVTINIVQPILGGASTESKHVDVDVAQ